MNVAPLILFAVIAAGIAIGVLRSRRKIGAALRGEVTSNPLSDRSTCCGVAMKPYGWTADGWVATCVQCGAWQYLGDNLDMPPIGFMANGRPKIGWLASAETTMTPELYKKLSPPLVEISVEDRMTPALRDLAARYHSGGIIKGPLPDLGIPARLSSETIVPFPNSRRPAPRSDASAEHDQPLTANPADVLGSPIMPEQQLRRPLTADEITEVTSGCTCHPDDRPPVCQHRMAASDCQQSYEAGVKLRDEYRATYPQVYLGWGLRGTHVDPADAGEPLAQLPPNIGGEGKPQYQGPHYESVLGESPCFAPYEMKHDPVPGQAIVTIGDEQLVGPLNIKPEDE